MTIARDNTPERLVSAAHADEEQNFELKLRPPMQRSVSVNVRMRIFPPIIPRRFVCITFPKGCAHGTRRLHEGRRFGPGSLK